MTNTGESPTAEEQDAKTTVEEKAKLTTLSQGLAAVALTLPTYWPQNPDAWFVKVEAQLKSAKISSEETSFYKVLAVLPESAAVKVREISHKPQYEAGDYKKLKDKLISGSRSSTLERLDRLCELKHVAHKKPSDVLLELENLFHSSQPEYIMQMSDYMKKFWWLRALPPSIQQCLLPLAEASVLDNLVIAADQMFIANPPIDRVSEIHTRLPGDQDISQVDQFASDQSEDLVMAALQHRGRPTPFRPQRREPLFCRYHAKFGDQAKRCAVGCSKYAPQQKN